MYKCVLFDMDGTLVNTYQGIFNSYQYAFDKMNLPFERDKFVGSVIGAPLLSVFQDTLGLSKEDSLKAVSYYRDYYSLQGKLEAKVYNGMQELLSFFKQNNILLGVATLKRETFALEILENLNLLHFFDVVYGIDDNDQRTKAELLQLCMESLHVPPSDSILVGDSEYDLLGAQEAGIDFLAVLYGFGFKNISSNSHDVDFKLAKTVEEIKENIYKGE